MSITWNITLNAGAGTTRFTTSDTAIDLSTIQVGDYANIVGSEFAAANRGSFPISAVDVRYSGSTLTQYFEISAIGSAQSGVVQSTGADIIFFRPSVSLSSNGVRTAVVSMTAPDVLDVVLPATSLAVNRTAKTAAYVQAQAPVAISSFSRVPNGTVTVTTAANHGLSVGSNVLIDGTLPTGTRPAPTAGNGTTTTDYSPVSIWSNVASMTGTALHNGSSLVLANGKLLLTGGSNSGTVNTTCRLFAVTATTNQTNGGIQYTYAWSAAASLPVARDSHSTCLLADGNVLLTGGWNGATEFSTAYLYTVASNTWSPSIALNVARINHTSTLLNDGRVLVAGGINTGATVQLTSCELFQSTSTSGNFANTGSLNFVRSLHQAVKLSDGKVLAIGGQTHTCEIFDPATGQWTVTGAMAYSRYRHVAILLPNDQVLVVGGYGYPATQTGTAVPIAAAEIYDYKTGRWASAGLSTARAETWATYIAAKNKVFIWGDSVSEYFNVSTRTWNLAPTVTARRSAYSGQLPSGAIVYAGGLISSVDTLTAAVYIPNSDHVSGPGINGAQTVGSVPSSTTFTFSTPDRLIYTAGGAGGTVTPTAALAATTIPGPYLIDSTGVSVTGTTTLTTQTLAKGVKYRSLKVSTGTAATFADSPGWLSIGFGTNIQFQIKYLGRLSNDELLLDYSQAMPASVPVGTTVTWLEDITAFEPVSPETLGCFYVTASSAGRVAASSTVDQMVAAGVTINKTIVYPSDRGLGGEGSPTSGASKLSDNVAVFAGNDIDSDVDSARNGD